MAPFFCANILFTAFSQSDFFGKIVFLSLFALSAICWVVLVHKFWMTKRVKEVSLDFHKMVEKRKDQLLELDLVHLPKPRQSELPHPYAAIFSSLKQKTAEVLQKNHYFLSQKGQGQAPYLTTADLELIESHVLTVVSAEQKRLEKNLFVLATGVTLAPFLGLLGTVWGILLTFAELTQGSSMSSNQVILGGLSTALATTVLGLLIAIPALISYNYLKNSLRFYASDMEDFLYSLLSTVELQYRKMDL